MDERTFITLNLFNMFLFWIFISFLLVVTPILIIKAFPFNDYEEFLKSVLGIGMLMFCITLVLGVSMHQEALDTIKKIEYVRTEFQDPCSKLSNGALSTEVIDFNQKIIDWKANGSNWRSGLIIPNKALEIELIK